MTAPFRIIPRIEINMPYGDGVGTATVPALEVWLHHSVTIAPDLLAPFDDDDAAIRTIARIGAERFGTAYGFPYTIGITPVGRIYAGHHPHKLGAHTGGRNSIARAIVWVGDYRATKPTRDQILATAWTLQEGKRLGWWRTAQLNGGHRQAPGAQTECPGNAAMAAIPEINRLAAGPDITTLEPEDDMPTAREIAEAVLDVDLGGNWSLADLARAWRPGETGKREAGPLALALAGLADDEANIVSMIRALGSGNVDVQALAAALAPLLPANVSAQELAEAVSAEQSRRLAS